MSHRQGDGPLIGWLIPSSNTLVTWCSLVDYDLVDIYSMTASQIQSILNFPKKTPVVVVHCPGLPGEFYFQEKKI